MTARRLATRRALERIIRDHSVGYTFLDRPATGERFLFAGARAAGTIRIDDLDVEVTIVVRQAVVAAERGNYRDSALALLVREGWRDSCSAYVPDRNPWRSYTSKTKSCSKPIKFALVSTTGHVSFACTMHARRDDLGAAIVELGSADLAAVRRERARLSTLRRAADARNERFPDDHPEVDISIERVLGRKR